MNFICKPCATASRERMGLPATRKRIMLAHKQCRGGTWCDCQHRVRQANDK